MKWWKIEYITTSVKWAHYANMNMSTLWHDEYKYIMTWWIWVHYDMMNTSTLWHDEYKYIMTWWIWVYYDMSTLCHSPIHQQCPALLNGIDSLGEEFIRIEEWCKKFTEMFKWSRKFLFDYHYYFQQRRLSHLRLKWSINNDLIPCHLIG